MKKIITVEKSGTLLELVLENEVYKVLDNNSLVFWDDDYETAREEFLKVCEF